LCHQTAPDLDALNLSIKNKTMKTTIKTLTLILSFTLFTSLVKAGRTEAAHETEKTIKQYITFPNIILPIEQSEKVEVIFTTGENGKVNFALAKTENKELKKIIEKQFADLYLPAIKSNVAYSVIINLKKV
jgi:hypothetical protein